MINLDNLEHLEQRATPGPWRNARVAYCTSASGDVMFAPSKEVYDADGAFVTMFRNAAPALIAELKAARSAIYAARNLLSSLQFSAPENVAHVLDTRGEEAADAIDEYDLVIK